MPTDLISEQSANFLKRSLTNKVIYFWYYLLQGFIIQTLSEGASQLSIAQRGS